MQVCVNGMEYLDHSELYISSIHQYLTIVFVKDISTGRTKEYADFLDSYASESDIEQIMRSGFKPYSLQEWLNGQLSND